MMQNITEKEFENWSEARKWLEVTGVEYKRLSILHNGHILISLKEDKPASALAVEPHKENPTGFYL